MRGGLLRALLRASPSPPLRAAAIQSPCRGMHVLRRTGSVQSAAWRAATPREFVGASRSVVWATGPTVRRGELRQRGMAQRASAKDAGLFGVVGLHTPGDFPQQAQKAAARVLELCAEVEASGDGGVVLGGRALLQTMDEISDTLCLVMDAAELCRSVHPDPEWKVSTRQLNPHLTLLPPHHPRQRCAAPARAPPPPPLPPLDPTPTNRNSRVAR